MSKEVENKSEQQIKVLAKNGSPEDFRSRAWYFTVLAVFVLKEYELVVPGEQGTVLFLQGMSESEPFLPTQGDLRKKFTGHLSIGSPHRTASPANVGQRKKQMVACCSQVR